MGLIRAYYGGLQGILSGLAKSTDHPSRAILADISNIHQKDLGGQARYITVTVQT